VIAAGRATLQIDGETHDVTEPEVIDAEKALPRLAPKRRKAFERIGIAQFLTLRT
jgi:hypothetical protein